MSEPISRLARHEHVFECSECGAHAASVLLLGPDAPLPQRSGPDIASMYKHLVGDDHWIIDVTHEGWGATQWPCPPDQIGQIEQALDEHQFNTLRNINVDLASFACKQCNLPYCLKHMPVERTVEASGDPHYDYYYTARCPRGHEFTFERW